MTTIQRRVWLGTLALLMMIAPLTALAQDETVTITGSRIVAEMIQSVVDTFAEATETTVELEVSGSSNGIDALCSGDVDMAASSRPITNDEAAVCAENSVEWVEVPVAYDALAVISNPAVQLPVCITELELNTLFGLSATDSVTTLGQVNAVWGDIAVELYAPAATHSTTDLLSTMLIDEGTRTDMSEQDSAADIISMVAEDVAGFGFVPYSAIMASDAEVNIVAVEAMNGEGCVEVSQESIESNTYAAARGLYLYVNAASLEEEGVSALLAELASDDAAAVYAENDFVAVGDAMSASIAANIDNAVTGRVFSPVEPLYSIALDVAGTINLASSAIANGPLTNLTSNYANQYPGIVPSVSGLGSTAALSSLCDGSAAGIAVDGAFEADCDAWTATLGHTAYVMVVADDADYATCLTTDQVATLWQAENGVAVTNWQELGEEFPDQELVVFLPRGTSSATDYIITRASGANATPRRDALEENNDADYRAAATANVEGAITYMTFAEYLAADANVTVVPIDAGEGCVTPYRATINDGRYALATPFTVGFNADALALPEVQGLVWSMLSDVEQLADASLFPVSSSTLESLQGEALALFGAAE